MPDHSTTATTMSAGPQRARRQAGQAPLKLNDRAGLILLLAMAAQIAAATTWAADTISTPTWLAAHVAISIVAGTAITVIMGRELLAGAKAWPCTPRP
ncbi:MAG: hypothetical protein JHD16_00180 [Solirubrobacteraceae bacterium]|nr:hypothetical protein [Solirubrobacteraceae bacterium]